MPLTESGRAFWSLDETEALLAAAPRWGFSAAKLRENVAQLSHFSTKQVSSKLADLQIQNRSGARGGTAKRKTQASGRPDKALETGSSVHDSRDLMSGVSSMLHSSSDVSSESNYDASSLLYAAHAPGPDVSEVVLSKKRERAFVPDFSPPDAKRPLLMDARMPSHIGFPYSTAPALPVFAPNAIQALQNAPHFSTATAAATTAPSASGALGYHPGLLLPHLFGLPSTAPLFVNNDKLASTLEPATTKRAVLLKEGFQVPAGTKPPLTEVPHAAIRCYSSPEIFKIVINPVLYGTTVDILIPQEHKGPSKALLKIDWKLAATPFDADFDFRRHPSLTEIYQCPLPNNINPSYTYSLFQAADAMCLIFALDRSASVFHSVSPGLETALSALSSLAAASSNEEESTTSSTLAPLTPPSSSAQTPKEDAPFSSNTFPSLSTASTSSATNSNTSSTSSVTQNQTITAQTSSNEAQSPTTDPSSGSAAPPLADSFAPT